MLSSTLSLPIALLTILSPLAAALPATAAPSVDLSALKTNYYWNLTALSSSYTPSGNYRSLDFMAAFSAQPNSTHCHSGYGANGNYGGNYEPCDNAALTFTSDLGVSAVSLSQLFVYNGVAVRVNGSAPLGLYGGSGCKYNAVGGGTCSQSQLTVKVSSAAVVTPAAKKAN